MGNQISSDMKQLLNLCTEQKPIKPADIRKQLVHEILRSILNGREGRGADHSDSQVALATAGRRNMMTCGAAAALAPRSAMARELPSPWSGRCRARCTPASAAPAPHRPSRSPQPRRARLWEAAARWCRRRGSSARGSQQQQPVPPQGTMRRGGEIWCDLGKVGFGLGAGGVYREWAGGEGKFGLDWRVLLARE